MIELRGGVMNRPVEQDGTTKTSRKVLGLIRMSAPTHPIYVHFTIALTTASAVFDALGLFFDAASLTTTGWWTLAGSIIMTLLALSSGLASRMRLPMEEGEARSFLRAHMALGPIFYGLLVAVGFWRMSLWQASRAVSWLYLAAMAAVLLVMLVQGYLGGELVYRYGAEVEGSFRKLPDITSLRPSSQASSSASEIE
jgi:uncharacterized membrane protein